jgi:hypothetical protein
MLARSAPFSRCHTCSKSLWEPKGRSVNQLGLCDWQRFCLPRPRRTAPGATRFFVRERINGAMRSCRRAFALWRSAPFVKGCACRASATQMYVLAMRHGHMGICVCVYTSSLSHGKHTCCRQSTLPFTRSGWSQKDSLRTYVRPSDRTLALRPNAGVPVQAASRRLD